MRLEDLGGWPPQQVEDYLSILIAEAAVSREKTNSSNSSGGMSSAEQTQKAYEAMRARALEQQQGG